MATKTLTTALTERGIYPFMDGSKACPNDPNTITVSGFYWTAAATQNLPEAGGYGFILHINRGPNIKMQFFYANSGHVWQRAMKATDSYTDWVQV